MGFSAGDIERYTYCPLSWWLSRAGIEGEGEAIDEGIVRHEYKGEQMSQWKRLLGDRSKALETSLYLVLIASAAATLAIEVTFLDGTELYVRLLALLSSFWLIVALIFLLRAIRKEQEAQEIEWEHGIITGELKYSDLDKPGEKLKAERYEIAGKPDYIVKRDGHLVPVEVKTGKAPERPHDSHVMQVATYCLLVEEHFGDRPPYGILSYEGRAFEIPYSEKVKDKVLETVLRMKFAEMKGEAHRNHERKGKCVGCSRRQVCPERLA